MLLAIDIGNTNVTLGAFEGDRLAGFWRLATDLRKTSDEYGTQILSCLNHGPRASREIQAVVYGSVVPRLNPVFDAVARKYLKTRALGIGPATPLGLKLRVDFPGEVGADRVMNALAVWKLFGGPSIVLDFGTATTFDCVSRRGEYLGGAILIGPGMAAKALADQTAQLPEVEVRRPGRVIGKNTVECIQAGLFFGYLGMVEKVLNLTLKEMGGGGKRSGERPIKVYATGGLADLFAGHLRKVRKVVPDLTLQGLRLAYELTSS